MGWTELPPLCMYEWWEGVRLTAMTLTKSFSPSVSKIVMMVCLAMVKSRPFMLPLMSTTIMISLGDVAAWMYLCRNRKGKQFIQNEYASELEDNSDPILSRIHRQFTAQL